MKRQNRQLVAIILFITLAFVVFVAINFYGLQSKISWDLTQSKRLQLSDRTKQYLQSAPLQQRKKPLNLTVVLHPNEFFFEDNMEQKLQSFITRYQDFAKGKINIRFINPVIDVEAMEELHSKYQQKFYQSTCIIDARQNPESTAQSLQNVCFLPLRNCFRTEYNELLERQLITEWLLEHRVTLAVVQAMEGKAKIFYYLYDKCLTKKQGSSSAITSLQTILAFNNIIVKPLKMTGLQTIPKDAEGVIAPDIIIDFNKAEIAVLEEFWGREKAAILLSLNPRYKLRNIGSFLYRYGVAARYDRIIKRQDNRIKSQAEVMFLTDLFKQQNLHYKTTILDGLSSSLALQNQREELTARNIHVFPLLEVPAKQGWWGEKSYEEETPAQFTPNIDHQQKLIVGAAIVRGDMYQAAKAAYVSRMVILGNSDFLAADKLRAEQRSYLQQIINWLIGRAELTGIGKVPQRRQKITLLAHESQLLERIFLFYLPAIAALMMLAIWFKRRM